MKKRVVAVFDLDGTLTTMRSIESAFFQYLLKKQKLSFQNILNAVVFYLKNVLKSPNLAVKKNKMYLKGLSVQKVDSWVKDFMKEYKNKLLNGEYLNLVKNHKALGHTNILITGAPEILVKDLFDRGLFDHIYTIILEINNDVYTGCISGGYYYGRAKKILIISLTEELDIELTQSYCYADSKSDIEMMSLFGHPVAVSPDSYLRRRALKNNWEILD